MKPIKKSTKVPAATPAKAPAKKPSPKAPETKVVLGEYNGHTTVSIVDAARYDADPSDRFAVIVTFGIRKLKAIFAHSEELEEILAKAN